MNQTKRITENAQTRTTESRSRTDRMFLAICLAITSFAVLFLAFFLIAIFTKGLRYFDMGFLLGDPGLTPSEAGIRIPLIGSIWLLGVCAATALPLGVGTAVLLEEFKPTGRVSKFFHALVQTNIRNLAGVPSIVYGIIGLTVFARMFGLFGTQGQFDPYQRYELSNGEVVVGIEREVEQETYQVNAGPLGTHIIERDKLAGVENFPAPGQPIEVEGLLSYDPDVKFVFYITLDGGGMLTIPAELVTDEDLVFGDAIKDQPLEVAIEYSGGSRYLVETPDKGLVEIPFDQIADTRQNIDTLFIREHTLRLADGTVLNGQIELDGDTLTVSKRGSDEGIPVQRSELSQDPTVSPWSYSTQFGIGDEDWFLHIRLPFGSGTVLTGGLTLMLVILPVIIIAAQEALRAVPDSLRSGAMALGATRWQSVWTMALPNAIPGIMTGTILAMSRAIGEAAPILVVGVAAYQSLAPHGIMGSGAAVPLQIYEWTSLADLEFQNVAATGIIVLLTVLLSFNAVAIFIRQKLERELS